MKYILLSLLVTFTQTLVANPEIIQIHTDEKVLTGYINDRYPFTMYLRYFEHSCCHISTYSVCGWYQYDEYKKKIPLVGFNFGNELYLYNFSNGEKDSLILNFEYEEGNFWDQMVYYKNLNGFNEKIIFNEEDGKHSASWTNNVSTLSLEYYPRNYSVYETKEYLKLNETNSFDLDNLPIWMSGFELFSYSTDNQRYILTFNYGSRHYVLGMCGAGIEAGYLVLKLDKTLHLENYEIFYTESCMDNFYTNNTEQTPDGLKHRIWSGEKDKEFDLIVDRENCTITMRDVE